MKRLLSVILCCTVLLGSVGCSSAPGAANSPSTTQESQSESSSLGTSVTPPTDFTFSTQHISKTLECGIQVDADVVLPDNLDYSSLSIYTGTLTRLTTDSFQQTVLTDKSVALEEQQTVSGYRLPSESYHYWEYSDGSALMCSEESLVYTTQLSGLALSCFNDGNKGAADYNADRYLSDVDFDFASAAQCLSQAKDLLAALNIPVAENVVCYRLDHATMNTVMREQGLAELMVLANPDLDASSDFAFTAEDDCYYFVFQLSVGGFPATEEVTGSSANGSVTPGSTVRVLYSKDGVSYLNVSGVYQTEAATGDNAGYDLDGALGLLNTRFSSMLMEGSYRVTDIAFEYVPQIQSDLEHVTFIPAWRFTVQNSVEVAGKSDPNQTDSIDTFETIFFDAISGQELLRDIE